MGNANEHAATGGLNTDIHTSNRQAIVREYGLKDTAGSGSVIKSFKDTTQGDFQGVISVTTLALENFNPSTCSRRAKLKLESAISAATFHATTEGGSIIILGKTDGVIQVYEASTFKCKLELRLDPSFDSSALERQPSSQLDIDLTDIDFEDDDEFEIDLSDPDSVIQALPPPPPSILISKAVPITALLCPDSEDASGLLLVGDISGAVHTCYLNAAHNGQTHVFRCPTYCGGSREHGGRGPAAELERLPSAVTSLTFCAGIFRHLIVGYADGGLHVFNLDSNTYVRELRMEGGETKETEEETAAKATRKEGGKPVLFLECVPEWDVLLSSEVSDGVLAVWGMDVWEPQLLELTLNQQLQQPKGTQAPQPTCMCFGAGRHFLFLGFDDGCFTAFQLQRVPQAGAGAAYSFALRPLREFRPSAGPQPGMGPPPVRWLTTLWYYAPADCLVTGDICGVTRVVDGVTGWLQSGRRRAGSTVNRQLRGGERSGSRVPMDTSSSSGNSSDPADSGGSSSSEAGVELSTMQLQVLAPPDDWGDEEDEVDLF